MERNHKLTRRDFLKYMAVSAGVLAAESMLAPVARAQDIKKRGNELLFGNDIKDEIGRLREFLRTGYDLTVECGPINDREKEKGYLGEALSPSEELSALTWLKAKVIKYPREYIQFCHLNTVRFIKHFARQDPLLSGWKEVAYSCTSQAVGCPYDQNIGTMQLSLEDNPVWEMPGGYEPRFDHELQHFYNSRPPRPWPTVDPEWDALNPGNGKEYTITAPKLSFNFFDPSSWDVLFRPERPPGFVELYGMMNEDEDQATIAQVMMNDPNNLAILTGNDPVLKKKVDLLKKRFKAATNGKMDDQYWKDISRGAVNENYWLTKKASEIVSPNNDTVLSQNIPADYKVTILNGSNPDFLPWAA